MHRNLRGSGRGRRLVAMLFVPAALCASSAGSSEPVSENEAPVGHQILTDRIHWWYQRHLGPGGFVPWNARNRALADLEENIGNGTLGVAAPSGSGGAITGDTWIPIGPRPIADGSNGYAGRVTAIATDPSSADTVYIGGSDGGVWKTTDGGLGWIPLTDAQDTLAIGAIALDPSNSGTVYVGTGDPNQGCDEYFGSGILKSTDAGGTWTKVGASAFANSSIAKIVVDPTTPATFWVANGFGTGGFVCYSVTPSVGVWKTTNGGTSFTKVLGSAQTGVNNAVLDLVMSGTSPNTLYAAVNGSGVWKTINGGTSWTKLAGGFPAANVGRIAIAIRPGTDVLFAAVEAADTGKQLGTWKSVDAGATWTAVAAVPSPSSCHYWDFEDICTYFGSSFGQCWYDLVIQAQGAADSAPVWLAGTGLFRSTSAGASWDDVCPPSVHVDQHAIAFGPDGKVWVGNDGGVWTTVDGSSWTNRNANLQIAQFYPGACLDPTNFDRLMGGTQDNGTPRFTGGMTWALQTFGDGGACVIDRASPSTTWYTSSQFLHVYKTTDGGLGYVDAINGLLDADTGAANGIAPVIACPSNSLVLIAGSDNAWRSNDGAGTWSSNSPDPIDPVNHGTITALAFPSASTSCAVYVAGTSTGRLYRTMDSGINWQQISGPFGGRGINDLAFDPTSSSVLYAAISGFGGLHLFKSANALDPAPSWSAISSGLPDTPIDAVLVDPETPSVLYIGTDLGIFKSTNGGTSWVFQNNGVPKVAVHDLVAELGTRAVVAFTHGRGAFRLNLVCTPPTFGGITSGEDPDSCDVGLTVFWNAPSSWGQLASTGTYEVQRFQGGSCVGAPTVLATALPASQLAYTDTTTAPGQSYSYRIVAVNNCGTPLSSAGANDCLPLLETSDSTPCASVGDTLSVSKNAPDAHLTWTAVVCSDLRVYAIYGSSTFAAPFPAGWTLLGTREVAYFDDPLDSGNVAYKVVSVDSCGNASGN